MKWAQVAFCRFGWFENWLLRANGGEKPSKATASLKIRVGARFSGSLYTWETG